MVSIFTQTALDPILNLWNTFITYLPGLVGAILVLILGYFIGVLVGHGVRKAIEKTKLEEWIEKTGRIDALGGIKPPRLVGTLVKWWIFIAFLAPAANMVKLAALESLLKGLAVWLPHLLAGIVIIIVGLIIADFAADSVSGAKKLKGIKLISPLVRVLILVYFITIALQEMGIRLVLAETTLLIFVGGIVLALSITIGIGFGFAFRKQAEKILTNIEKKI
jgi:hypothetical protein